MLPKFLVQQPDKYEFTPQPAPTLVSLYSRGFAGGFDGYSEVRLLALRDILKRTNSCFVSSRHRIQSL